MTHKNDLENRLDETFSDLNSKVAGLDKSHSLAREALRAEFRSISQSMSSRIDNIEHELKSLLERAAASAAPTAPPPGFGASSQPRTTPGAAPSMPQSWSPLSGSNDAWANYSPSTPPAANSSPWTGAPAPQATPGPAPASASANVPPTNGWSAGFGTNYGVWAQKDWTVDHRVSPSLVSFDVQINHYDDWRNRVRDHFIGTNMHYREVFDLIEQRKHIITFKFLSETKVATLPNIHWPWVAPHIWTFRGKRMTN